MVTVLLAVHNGERYLNLAIDSILNQSYPDFELLIGFNGTTDNSRDIVDSFSDNRIKIFDYRGEKGKAKTLNKLLKEVKSDWVALQDDDDIWLKNKLEIQLQYTEKYDVIGTFINYINETGHIIGQPHLSNKSEDIKRLSLAGANQVANTSAIFKKQDAISVDGWNEDLDGIEDFDFWLKLLRSGKLFYNVPKYLVKHRLHQNSSFNTKTYDISKIL